MALYHIIAACSSTNTDEIVLVFSFVNVRVNTCKLQLEPVSEDIAHRKIDIHIILALLTHPKLSILRLITNITPLLLLAVPNINIYTSNIMHITPKFIL